jgi:hypothetical protein
MKSKKIAIVVGGVKVELPAEVLRMRNDGVTPYIYGSPVVAGKIVKAYVKEKYPNILIWCKSNSFANGNSMDVHMSNVDGTPVEMSIYSDINGFAHNFEYGKFNGWTDCYDSYEESGLKTDKGMEIEAGVKYVSVDNKAPFGTYPDVMRMLEGMMGGEYSFGPLSLEKAIEKVKGYNVTDATIDKALAQLTSIVKVA